ncbi:hypothetical protein HMPREF9162_1692 [Selenomonas sp. oral taxon 137 str. F0430]|uniref:hypothetical protein n=1 Tax=Selenomonas sp. oral taxon 137 TaxID=712531 RepID=UPI0001EB2BCB|nr:hypothetical protein [Selenomonas sp. oral taxon 137]EFR41171.1 hypothetical protein HMPREF9162_1692 [Selenomonas sp. oral taxon 137 str. F0430]
MSIKLKPSVCIAWLPFGRIHLKQIIYATVIPVFRQPVQVRGDTSRSLNRSIATHADTLRDIRIVKQISVKADMLRRIGRCDVALGDTKRRLIRQLRILADTRIEIPHTIRYAEFRERGIRSFSVTLGELSLSDNIQLETVNPLSIGANVQGRVMDYDFRFLVEETSQRGIVQSVKGTYSKDTLLYTPIHIYVERAKVSRYAAEIASALGLQLHRLTDDFTPSQNFEGSGMTYHDFISSLFGWTAKLPQRQINVFIRGDTLHIIQRGMEESVIDITNWPHAQPTVERKLLRSVWHSSHNDSTGAHNEEDTSPVPFTGTISFKEISRTYSNGFLVRETNENGYSTYSYDGEYLAEKRTHNTDGSTSRTDYAYASTGRDVYLFKEWERTTEAVNDGKKHNEYDWEDWNREKGTERITYHAPLGYGWYATTVYVDGVLEGSSLSQGKPGGKASQFTVEQSNLSLGASYASDDALPYSSLIDTEFPVVGTDYLRALTREIEWLNRKTQETVTVEIRARIQNGVPDIDHIVDFTERIRFEGHEYFLQSNTVELTPRLLRQTIKMVRWYG